MRFEPVPVTSIDKTWGPRPTERMIDHVKRHGILVPILLAEVPDEDGVLTLRIVDGNRRVAAARALHLDEIPAIIISADEATVAELTLATNTLRTSNAVTEWWAIDDLHQLGVSDRTITDHTGITPATLKSRARFGDLDPRLFSGLVYGQVAPSVIEKAARLPQEAQDRLGDLFHEKGYLQTWQVEEEAKHYRQPRPSRTPVPPESPLPDWEEDPFPPSDDRALAPASDAAYPPTAWPGEDMPSPTSGNTQRVRAENESEPAQDLMARLVSLAGFAKSLGIDRTTWLHHAANAFDHSVEHRDPD